MADAANTSEPFLLDFDAIFAKYMASNQKTWAHDRTQSLGASEVFQCIRKGFFSKRGKALGFKPDEDETSWGALERGNLIENYFVVPAVRTALPDGLVALYTGDEQTTLIEGRASATPDGLITGLPQNGAVRIKAGSQDVTIPDIKSDCITLEVKSIDPRANLLHEKEVHFGQTQMQLGLFHRQTQYRPHYAIILYVDASFVDKLTPFVVEYDEALYLEGVRRANAIWEHDDPTTFMPEGKFDESCEHCPWKTACGEAAVKAMPKKHTETQLQEIVDDVAPEINNYLDLRDQLADLTKDFEVAKEKVKDALIANNVRKVVGADWSAVWTTAKGRATLDKDAMIRDGINLSKYEKIGNEGERLTVTRTVDKEARKEARKAKKNSQ